VKFPPRNSCPAAGKGWGLPPPRPAPRPCPICPVGAIVPVGCNYPKLSSSSARRPLRAGEHAYGCSLTRAVFKRRSRVKFYRICILYLALDGSQVYPFHRSLIGTDKHPS
jgi:hypothetical protein